MIKGLKLIGVALVLSLVISACGESQQGDMRSQSYDNDGYLGFTNTNPNLQTSPTYHNQTRDTEMIRQTVRNLDDVKNARVVYYGANAEVTLYINKGLSSKQRVDLRSDAYEAIQSMLPRYIITVKLKEQSD